MRCSLLPAAALAALLLIGPAASAAEDEDPWSRVELEDRAHAPLLERQAELDPELPGGPVALAVLVVAPDLAGLVSEVATRYDTMENPASVTVTITERGILDDDLLGVRHAIRLDRNRNDQWRVTGYQRGELRRHHLKP